MTTAHVEIPTDVERVVLTFSNGEVQELRRRVEDIEVRCDVDPASLSLISMLSWVEFKHRSDTATGSASSEIQRPAGMLLACITKLMSLP